MGREQSSTRIAGIDVSKRRLDVAIHGLEDELGVDNGPGGLSELVGWLRAREVGRVGLEASGGYERGVREALERAGFEVVVHQPLEVKGFAQSRRWRGKTDRRDARLIAWATAEMGEAKVRDPRLVELADRPGPHVLAVLGEQQEAGHYPTCGACESRQHDLGPIRHARGPPCASCGRRVPPFDHVDAAHASRARRSGRRFAR